MALDPTLLEGKSFKVDPKSGRFRLSLDGENLSERDLGRLAQIFEALTAITRRAKDVPEDKIVDVTIHDIVNEIRNPSRHGLPFKAISQNGTQSLELQVGLPSDFTQRETLQKALGKTLYDADVTLRHLAVLEGRLVHENKENGTMTFQEKWYVGVDHTGENLTISLPQEGFIMSPERAQALIDVISTVNSDPAARIDHAKSMSKKQSELYAGEILVINGKAKIDALIEAGLVPSSVYETVFTEKDREPVRALLAQAAERVRPGEGVTVNATSFKTLRTVRDVSSPVSSLAT